MLIITYLIILLAIILQHWSTCQISIHAFVIKGFWHCLFKSLLISWITGIHFNITKAQFLADKLGRCSFADPWRPRQESGFVNCTILVFLEKGSCKKEKKEKGTENNMTIEFKIQTQTAAYNRGIPWEKSYSWGVACFCCCTSLLTISITSSRYFCLLVVQ